MNAFHRVAWKEAWSEVGVSDPDATLLDELIGRYNEPHRKYHTMQHLGECFGHYAPIRSSADHPAEIALALWFHDAIYEIGRNDNEERSADWARSAMQTADATSSAADRVHALILATKHDARPSSSDEQILVDIDLAILGADNSRFDEYEQQVREEYAQVQDDLFRAGRGSILQKFLDRDRIYSTDHFYRAFEEKARLNLLRSIQQLGG